MNKQTVSNRRQTASQKAVFYALKCRLSHDKRPCFATHCISSGYTADEKRHTKRHDGMANKAEANITTWGQQKDVLSWLLRHIKVTLPPEIFKIMLQQYPSQLFAKAVSELAGLPGVGQKTALRLALFLLRQDKDKVSRFVKAIGDMRNEIRYCTVCHNISDTEVCPICSNKRRDASTVCVVENVQDVMAIENTQQYNGLYHVLGGVISPMDGIGPGDIEIDSLIERVAAGGVTEVILALSPDMEGDTTNFYIYRKLSKADVKLSVIARGVSVGEELEYTDEVTLGRSIINRVPFDGKQ